MSDQIRQEMGRNKHKLSIHSELQTPDFPLMYSDLPEMTRGSFDRPLAAACPENKHQLTCIHPHFQHGELVTVSNISLSALGSNENWCSTMSTSSAGEMPHPPQSGGASASMYRNRHGHTEIPSPALSPRPGGKSSGKDSGVWSRSGSGAGQHRQAATSDDFVIAPRRPIRLA